MPFADWGMSMGEPQPMGMGQQPPQQPQQMQNWLQGMGMGLPNAQQPPQMNNWLEGMGMGLPQSGGLFGGANNGNQFGEMPAQNVGPEPMPQRVDTFGQMFQNMGVPQRNDSFAQMFGNMGITPQQYQSQMPQQQPSPIPQGRGLFGGQGSGNRYGRGRFGRY